ncbi:serine hydroxymethyltransferase [Candidatus Aerophobetes bacterium]|nr:serine hydroxymethyltransferase [Candidatus Aerophobetes bacterium]
MEGLLSKVDSEIGKILQEELTREQKTLSLIPSENYASKAVLEAQGSIFTNKYAEGYPGKRYYQGCRFIDKIEEIAIQRAKKLFKCEHVNVQAHSGTQANMAVYHALLKPGDIILSLSLAEGGHLSHGGKGTLPYKYYRIVNYGLDKASERFDYKEIRQLAKKFSPRLIIVGTSAYPRKINFSPWKEIAEEVGAYLLADMAHLIGLIAAGVHPDPVPYVDVVTATTQKTLRGPRGGLILCRKELAPLIDRAVFPGIQGGPFMHIIAAKAVCFKEAGEPQFKDYQKRVLSNAKALAKVLKEKGFRLISGGTDNHLLLVDVFSRGIPGDRAADLLEEGGIVVNKNSIPFDSRSPVSPSGIRLGTPAVTTRGMGELEMEVIGEWISEILLNPNDEILRKRIRKKVEEICEKFPIYKN